MRTKSLLFGARFSVQPWASAHGLAVISGWRAEARHSTLKRAPRRPLAMLFLYKPLRPGRRRYRLARPLHVLPGAHGRISWLGVDLLAVRLGFHRLRHRQGRLGSAHLESPGPI